ncbi:MAG TPA: histidine kinase [Ignavibacteria bacterium]|nr:histidine kinase [Ignavibacteria bacterium]
MAKRLINYVEIKIYLWFIVYLTVIISVFDFKTDFNVWLYEIGRNFILISSVSWTYYIVSYLFGLNKVPGNFKKIVLQIVSSALVSLIGGTLGWKLNDISFGFYVSHPLLFFILIFLITLFTSFAFQSYISWKESKDALVKKKETEERLIQLKTKAELDAIRSKLNPHFLFNTLNSVMSLIHSDPQKAEEMLQKFSDLLRNIQQINKKEFIELSEEIEIIDEYLSIEKIRFGKKLIYKIIIDDEIKKAHVPAMILQPVVENSIKHGISSGERGNIVISAQKAAPGSIILKVSDSGNGFVDSAAGNGFGLSGIKERLELIYGSGHSFRVTNNGGCEISITIPAEIPEGY